MSRASRTISKLHRDYLKNLTTCLAAIVFKFLLYSTVLSEVSCDHEVFMVHFVLNYMLFLRRKVSVYFLLLSKSKESSPEKFLTLLD